MTGQKSKRRLKAFAGGVLTALLSVTLAGALLCQSGMSAFADESGSVETITADYSSYEETLRAGEELNEELQGEGSVLLKNENDALPLRSSENKITLFGIASSNLQTGGSGSGAGTITDDMNEYDLYDSLTAAGFKVNQAVKGFYDKQTYTDGEETDPADLSLYEDSFDLYDDAAIIVIARNGGEMADRDRSGMDGDEDKHYLELNSNEDALIEYVTEHFDKVIVLINSSNAMELGKLEDNEDIDSILWIGHTGSTGAMAIGQILNGEINPSGRLVDVYMADFKKDPTWFNSGDQSHLTVEGETGSAALYAYGEDGSSVAYATCNESYDAYYTVMYKEGIYMGYRWYETADAEGFFDRDGNTGDIPEKYGDDSYYNRNTGVVYPFGYGMSYTTFEWSDYEVSIPADQEGDVTVTLTVENTGSVAGKDVVEIYSHSPYIDGGIEKAEVDLVEYAKTDLLEPGESQEITIEFALRDIAQFDYNDANANGYSTYEIDAADGYVISARSDSHNVKDDCSYTFDVSSTIVYTTDENSGAEITNMFSQGDLYDTLLGKDAEDYGMVTRADGDFDLPTASTTAERTVDSAYLEEMDRTETYTPDEDTEEDLWYRESVPDSWTQVADEDRTTTLDVATLAGKSYTAPTYDSETGTWTESDDEDTQAWEAFLNQMSYDELVTLSSYGSSGINAMDSISLPETSYNDGPGQLKGGGNGNLTGDYGTYYVSHVVIASTWNIELAEKQGQIIGNESLYLGTDGWWGPGANTHRSPFGGRNFEYYSQDGVQGGKIAAAVITGVTKKGVQVFIKHYAMNEQELLRGTDSVTICSEQAMRQIYLKTFELAFKAGCNGAMTSTTRTGIYANANNYRLLTSLTREEWGATALFMEDVEHVNWHDIDLNLRAGNSLPLTDRTGSISGTWDDENKCVTVDKSTTDSTQVVSATQWVAVRNSAQHVIESVVNSNAMENGLGTYTYTGGTLDSGIKGASYSASVAQDVDATVVNYELVNGSLPDGIELSDDGTVSGTATEAGTFSFTVQMSCEGWVTKTAAYTLTVEEPLSVEDDMTAVILGMDTEFQIVSAVDTSSATSVAYSITDGALPEGMEINDNGLIYGTPEEEGEFDFTVELQLVTTTVFSFDDFTFEMSSTNTYSTEFTMVVSGAAAESATATYTVTFETNGGSSVASQTVTAGDTVEIPGAVTKDGYEFAGWYYDEECTAVADLGNAVESDITYYAKWVEVTETSSGSSGLTILWSALISLGIFVVGTGVVLFAFRKKGRKN